MKKLYLRINNAWSNEMVLKDDIKALSKAIAALIECNDIPEFVYNPTAAYQNRCSLILEFYYEDKEKNKAIEEEAKREETETENEE